MTRIVELSGYRIADTSARPLARLMRRRIASGRKTALMFVNASFAVQCRHIADRLRASPEVVLVNDGIGVEIGARMIHRRGFAANLNGTDFTPYLLRHLPAGTRVYLVGAKTVSVEGAAAVFGRYENLEIVGACNGYEELREPGRIRAINQAQPDVVLVAMGNPRQEEWILAHRGEIQAPLMVGVGALFDFVSGQVVRAPEALRRMRLEWAFRLAREPRRLIRRYTIDNAHFILMALKAHRQSAP